MSQKSPSLTPQKRKLAEPPDPALQSLTKQDHLILNAILRQERSGIWSRNLKQETKLPDNSVRKSLNILLGKNLIKQVGTVQYRGRKMFMGFNFEPAEEVSGGVWYTDGSLDTEFISLLKDQCVKVVYKLRVATAERVANAIRSTGIFKAELENERVEEILRALVLDDEVVELKSDGLGEFGLIPVGKVCYKCSGKKPGRGEPRVGGMASIPCGVCPVVQQCTPDGLISPKTCKYYSDLSF